MSMTLATATEIIARRVRAEEASPGASDLELHSDTIAAWLNELTSQVVALLRNSPEHFQALVEFDKSISLTGGNGALPTSPVYNQWLAVKVGTSKIRALVTDDSDKFANYENLNFDALTPEDLKPPNQNLLVLNDSISLTGGEGTLPDDFGMIHAVKSGSNKLRTVIAENGDIFANYENLNFDFLISPENAPPNQSLLVVDHGISLTNGMGDLPADFGKAYAVKYGTSKYNCFLFEDPKIYASFDGSNWLTEVQSVSPIALIANGKLYAKNSTSPPASGTAYLDYFKKPPYSYVGQGKIQVKGTSETTAYIDYFRKLPYAYIGGGKLYIKPTSHSTAYLDYAKQHPTISGSQDTVFSEIGDDVLIELFMAQYYTFKADGDSDSVLAALSQKHLNKALGIANGINLSSD